MAIMLWRHMVIKFDNDPGLFEIKKYPDRCGRHMGDSDSFKGKK